MGFQAWLRQVQEKLYYFCKRNERPGDIEHNNFSPENEESSPIPMLMSPCACQTRWEVDNLKLPSIYLLSGKDNRFCEKQCVSLHKATLTGHWKKMKRILSRNDETILRSSLTKVHETALYVAVAAGHAAIVKKLVERMEPQDLELQDSRGNTAFCAAVGKRSVEIAKILMQKREEVVLIRGANNKTTLDIAVAAGHPEMIRFVYQNFGQHIYHLKRSELEDIFLGCIHASVFDLAIEMLRSHPNLAWARNAYEEAALEILARKPSAFAGKSPTRLTKLLNHVGSGFNTISMQNEARELTELLCKAMSSDELMSFEDIVDYVSSDEILFEAAKLGNDKFLAVLIDRYPDLVFRRDDKHSGSIFHIAVLHRHAGVFNLIHNLGLQNDALLRSTVGYPDEENDVICYNMLHLVAKLLSSMDPLSKVSGPALQMQLELLWFKEVENLMPPTERAMRDSKCKLTPRELFTKEHERLRKDGEEWMRSIAQSGMLVATLITTVVFTAASTLPGGNKEQDGSPANIGKVTFHVFMVSNAVAMCSSIISTLFFLSILTSRYAEKDFLRLLPLKLLFGLTALLFSMAAVMVSFATTFFLAYEKDNLVWVPRLATAMSVLPVISFVVLEYQLLRDVSRFTFGSRNLFRPNKPTFY